MREKTIKVGGIKGDQIGRLIQINVVAWHLNMAFVRVCIKEIAMLKHKRGPIRKVCITSRSPSKSDYVNIARRALADSLAILDKASVDPLKPLHNPDAGQRGAVVEKPAQDDYAVLRCAETARRISAVVVASRRTLRASCGIRPKKGGKTPDGPNAGIKGSLPPDSIFRVRSFQRARSSSQALLSHFVAGRCSFSPNKRAARKPL